mmetsp:Transcript_5399/g.7050  ORF Transcript_5399/g.7050 Transcript_5399/m.7050 type:complete len:456 (-) Transcript_5399:243-1610(-)
MNFNRFFTLVVVFLVVGPLEKYSLLGLSVEQDYTVFSGLRFAKEVHAYEDPDFPNSKNKYRRWRRNMSVAEHDDSNMDLINVEIKDVAGREHEYTFLEHGFEYVKLKPSIMPIFSRISEKGLEGTRVGPVVEEGTFAKGEEPLEDILAKALQGWDVFNLDGLVVLNLRCSGFVIRKGGPLGIPVNGTGFDMVAHRVHIDQDLEGDPLKSMGLTWLFHLPFIEMLNVWTPLKTPRMRPLAVMDVRTVNPLYTLRYRANSTRNAGGKIGSFQSDRLMTMYHKGQDWYWNSNMTFGDALVFYTGRNPHTSFTIPGEDIQYSLLQQLDTLKSAIDDILLLRHLCSESDDGKINLENLKTERISPHALEAVVRAIEVKDIVCSRIEQDELLSNNETMVDLDRAIDFLSRSSLEIRCVSIVFLPSHLILSVLFVFAASLILCKLCNFFCFPTSSSKKYKQA